MSITKKAVESSSKEKKKQAQKPKPILITIDATAITRDYCSAQNSSRKAESKRTRCPWSVRNYNTHGNRKIDGRNFDAGKKFDVTLQIHDIKIICQSALSTIPHI
jgi:hypothetical protein